MNIENFEEKKYSGDFIKQVFEEQRQLIKKYGEIEGKNGFPIVTTKDLDDRFLQAKIKDFAWRTTEEIAESYEAYVHDNLAHQQEEMADALHFLVELCIHADYIPLSTAQADNTIGKIITMGVGEVYFTPVYYLGLACNCLKNKPWKQTHFKTDVNKFKLCLTSAFKCYLDACQKAKIYSLEDLWNLYSRKNQVNQFRQMSNY